MNNKELIFFRCPICGNIVVKLHDSGVPVFCCGKAMEVLNANTSDGVGEKHLPMLKTQNDAIKVQVGEILHPHTQEHHIEFIVLETNKGVYIHYLEIDAEPETEFNLSNGEIPLNVYAYCNLHSLWKTEIK